MSDFDVINGTTGFANGDEFTSPDQVRDYFTPAAQTDMFGLDAVTDADTLSGWAELVIKNGWHMAGAVAK